MKRFFAIGVAWTALSNWVEHAATVIIFVVIARLIGTEAFGIVAMAFAVLFFGEILVRDTVTEAIVERARIEDGRLEATLVALVGFALVIVLVLCAIAPLAAAVYGQAQVADLLVVSSPCVLMIGLAGVSTALLRRRLDYRALAIRAILGVFAGGIVGIWMAVEGYGGWSLVGQRLALMVVNCVFAIHAAGWLPRRWPRRADFALLGGLGPRVVVLRSITHFIAQTATVALGIFAEPSAVGVFAFATRLVEIIQNLIVTPLRLVAQSAIAEIRRQAGSTAGFYLELNELAALAAFAAFAGLGLIALPVVRALMGPEWVGAAQILPFLCLAGAVLALTAMQEAYLLAMDRVGSFLGAVLIEALLGVVLIGAASRYGPVAAAGAVALRAVLAFPLLTRAALRPERIAVADLASKLVAPVAAALAMAAAVAGWRHGMLDRLPDPVFVAGAIAVGVTVFAAMLVGVMPGTLRRLRSFLDHD